MISKLSAEHPSRFGANNRKGHKEVFGFVNPFVLLGAIVVLTTILAFIA